jgi:hypothetical protein
MALPGSSAVITSASTSSSVRPPLNLLPTADLHR